MSEVRFPRPFGKYTLLRPLARGGGGEIYLAATGELGGAEKLCVIKKVPSGTTSQPEAAEPNWSRVLLDEARVMVRLNHINLVQVFDVGIAEGGLYLAMEFVAGRDLRAAWNRCADVQARIPVEMALFLVREVARGLAFAHSYGGLQLVHRDIAPPNILLSWQGEVKITDFGLAASRLKREQADSGVVLGRQGYLAPEQAQSLPVDRRTDIFALGVVLWELLTGRPLQTLHSDVELIPPSTFAPDLPRTLDAVVLRALNPRKEGRFASADEMRQAVSRELLRLSPDVDQGSIVDFLRSLYGDQIEKEQIELERLLREDLPKVRASLRAPATLRLEQLAMGREDQEDAPPEEVPPPLGPGGEAIEAEQRLGHLIDARYRLDRVLGIGGMGAVYEAEHVAIRKKVALKILHRHFSAQHDLVTRFRREAQAASRVGHPNIIDVTDFGYTTDGSAYIVMEHLDGMDLGQVLSQKRRLSQERAVAIVLQLAQALSAAHSAGVVHRDLKPENIFLLCPEEAPGDARPSMRDIVKVLDFGIAMRVEMGAPTRLTNPGLTVGTPEYMAPEQASGGTVDFRADIYAVGTILYETITGRVPFHDSKMTEILARKTRESPMPPRAHEPGIHPALDRLITRCLEREPERRPQTMEEVAHELQAVQASLRAATAPTPMGGVWIGGERRSIPAAVDPTVPVVRGPRARADEPHRPLVTPQPAPIVQPQSAASSVILAGTLADETRPKPAPPEPPPPPPSNQGPKAEAPERGPEVASVPPPLLAPPPLAPLAPLVPPMPPPVAPAFRPAEFDPLVSSHSVPVESLRSAEILVTPKGPSARRYPSAIVAGVLLVGIGFLAARTLSYLHQDPSNRPSTSAGPENPLGTPPKDPRDPDPPPAKKPGPEQALLEWARRAADNGRYVLPAGDNLAELLQRIEALSPGNPEARRLRDRAIDALVESGRAALRRKDPEEALVAYRALMILRADVAFPRSDLSFQLQARARSWNKGKTRQKALESAQAATEVDPDSVQARLLLADIFLGSGQRERAAAEYQKALDQHPLAQEERIARQGLSKASGTPKRKRK